MMDRATEKKLHAITRLGKEIWLNSHDTGIPMVWGVVEDEVGIVVDGAKHVIHRVRLADGAGRDGESYGYKCGSFIVDHTGNIKWSQYSQLLSENEYRELLALVKTKGWPIL